MKAADARVLLTGASGGIGQAAAAVLVEAGASLMLAGRSGPRLQALAATLGGGETPSRRIAWHAAELTRHEETLALAERGAAWGCNVIVHGAGVPSFGRLEALPVQEVCRLIEVNLLAPMLLTQALLPHLLTRPKAQVICIGSALGRIGLPGFAAYSASKFGLRGFAEALRRELAEGPVRVQYLGPRSTRTPFNDARVDTFNRLTGTPTDSPQRVAQALLALLESERPERYIGFPEGLAMRLNGVASSWLDGAFARHRRCLPPQRS